MSITAKIAARMASGERMEFTNPAQEDAAHERLCDWLLTHWRSRIEDWLKSCDDAAFEADMRARLNRRAAQRRAA